MNDHRSQTRGAPTARVEQILKRESEIQRRNDTITGVPFLPPFRHHDLRRGALINTFCLANVYGSLGVLEVGWNQLPSR